MNQDELERIKKDIIPVLLKARVKKAAFFGSYARGENTSQSDVDILVDLPKHATLIDLVGIKQDIEERLKMQVDIVEYDGIHPLLKETIFKYQYPIL